MFAEWGYAARVIKGSDCLLVSCLVYDAVGEEVNVRVVVLGNAHHRRGIASKECGGLVVLRARVLGGVGEVSGNVPGINTYESGQASSALGTPDGMKGTTKTD